MRRRRAAPEPSPAPAPAPTPPPHRAAQYLALADVLERHGADDLTRHERRVSSQNGEDGVLAEIVRRTGPGGRTFAEFGAGAGGENVCALLADALGWSGLFLEPDPAAHALLQRKYAALPRVRTERTSVTPDNALALLRRLGVPQGVDVLSIDIDGRDLWVWRALAPLRPRIVVVEYNAGLGFERALTVPADHEEPWDGTDFFGASLPALELAGAEQGMRLVHTELTGTNSFFVRDELAGDLPADPPRRGPNYLLAGLTHVPDPHRRGWAAYPPGEHGAGTAP